MTRVGQNKAASDAFAHGKTSTMPMLGSNVFLRSIHIFCVVSVSILLHPFFSRSPTAFDALLSLVADLLSWQVNEGFQVTETCLLARVDLLDESIQAVIVTTMHDWSRRE